MDAERQSEIDPTVLYLDDTDEGPFTDEEIAEFFSRCPFVLEKDANDSTDNTLSNVEFEQVLAVWRSREPRRPLETEDVERIIGRALHKQRHTSCPCELCESPETTSQPPELADQSASQSSERDT
jgi:hypothetical protein